MNEPLRLDPKILGPFCERHHVLSLALFGSQLTGAARPDSDIDLLVKFEPEREPGLMGVAQMEIELGTLLGRKVDLRTAEDLSIYFRDQVRSQAVVQFARG
jgi:predicted nucleotidyltransferase